MLLSMQQWLAGTILCVAASHSPAVQCGSIGDSVINSIHRSGRQQLCALELDRNEMLLKLPLEL